MTSPSGVISRGGSISFCVWIRPMQWEEFKIPLFVQFSVSLKKTCMCLRRFFSICFIDNNTIRLTKNGRVEKYFKKTTISSCHLYWWHVTPTLSLIPLLLENPKCWGFWGKGSRRVWHLFPLYFHVFSQCSIYWRNTIQASGILWKKWFCKWWGKIFFLEGSCDFCWDFW